MLSVEDLDGKTIDVAGTHIHYHDWGHGKPIILLHGAGPGASGLSNFRKNMAALSAKYRVLVIDFPGFGKSENKVAPGGIFEVLGELVLAFMDALGIEKASLLGNSLGGGTALCAALKSPERVDRLVLMGPGGGQPPFSPMPTEGLLRLLTYYEGYPTLEKLKGFISLLVFDPASVTPELIEERYKASLRPDVVDNSPMRGRGGMPADELWKKALGQLTHETLIIWGREDRVVPLDAAFTFLKSIPNARLHVFPKCGHWAQWEKVDEFNTLVLDFLDEA
jgi:4,5:9,10-diseco-3-hydroxy-5,9,17-trioxoandrosta-1(10),2-diene-4-oate hydrolase